MHHRPLSHKKNCPTRKVRYRDQAEVKVALNRTKAKGNLGDKRRREARFYRCPMCNGWHLTSNA